MPLPPANNIILITGNGSMLTAMSDQVGGAVALVPGDPNHATAAQKWGVARAGDGSVAFLTVQAVPLWLAASSTQLMSPLALAPSSNNGMWTVIDQSVGFKFALAGAGGLMGFLVPSQVLLVPAADAVTLQALGV